MADKMIRCSEGHFYDPSKHSACPWCAVPQSEGLEQKAWPARPGGMEMPPPLPGPSFSAPAPPPLPSAMPSISISASSINAPPIHSTSFNASGIHSGATFRGGRNEAAGIDPVVGWLVCVGGPDRGKDFRLRMEKNYIGRSPSMDVVIEGDKTVSREKHGVVIFDPKRQVFWVLPGEASGLVYLNGEVVHTPMQMQRDDVIELGQTKLALIPFCGEKYNWSEPIA